MGSNSNHQVIFKPPQVSENTSQPDPPLRTTSSKSNQKLEKEASSPQDLDEGIRV
jgi:hypothetical protein